MCQRFLSVWFSHLVTDWFIRKHQELEKLPFVISAPSHGRLVITASSALAQALGAHPGMVVADARAAIPSLTVLDEKPGLADQLLKGLAGWCIRFTPFVAMDPPDGLLFDVTGCSHLRGGDTPYLTEITKRLEVMGYQVRAAMADTAGAAWALARFGNESSVIETSQHVRALLPLPPAALRLEPEVTGRLYKLGIRKIEDFINMPRGVLRRRFGQAFIKKLGQALGEEQEYLDPIEPVIPYQERLPCLEPIVSATGIEIALEKLLTALCDRLQQEQKGLRQAMLKCYRVDGKVIAIGIGTNRPSRNVHHLFKLFDMKLAGIEPALGIELFVLEAPEVEDHNSFQENLWEKKAGVEDERISELLDRLAGKFGSGKIHRYLPAEHYWPERSFKPATSLDEKLKTSWRTDRPRPLELLSVPEPVMVTAPIPDYPPMLFRYKGKLHKIIQAEGPERIEQEWWIQEGEHRDYYRVEDEAGCRYWLYRSGHYDVDKPHQWFLHGFFA